MALKCQMPTQVWLSKANPGGRLLGLNSALRPPNLPGTRSTFATIPLTIEDPRKLYP